MKTTAFAAVLLIAGATSPAFADGHNQAQGEHAGHAGHAGHVAAEAPKAAFTVDTPIEALLADAKAAAVLEKHLPGIAAHPAYEQIKGMSLVQVQPWSQGLITDETIAKVKEDLSKIA